MTVTGAYSSFQCIKWKAHQSHNAINSLRKHFTTRQSSSGEMPCEVSALDDKCTGGGGGGRGEEEEDASEPEKKLVEVESTARNISKALTRVRSCPGVW